MSCYWSNDNRAEYIERCTFGSRRGLCKPAVERQTRRHFPTLREYLSKSTGQTTVLKENFSESIQEGKLFGNKSRQTSLQEVQRPLMTPDECRRLPGLRKDSSGDVVDAGNMLIFPAGYSAIYGIQSLYFLDAEMDRRSKIKPPEKSDNLIEVAF